MLLRFTQSMIMPLMSGPGRSVTIVSLVILITACGFQLRGELNLSQEMSPIYLQQNSVFELGREIKRLLASNKIQITNNEKQAKTLLTLLNEVKSRRVLSVDSDGRAREYLLNYTVDFSIKMNHSEDTSGQGSQDSISHDSISHDSISVARSLLYEPVAVLAVDNESEILYRDMQRDVARLILLKLQAISRQRTHDEGL